MPGRHRTNALGPAASGHAEARWFLPGAIPQRLRPAGKGRLRTDLYHASSLNPMAAWKRRGGRLPEFKYRDPNPRMVLVHGIGGFAEQWHKHRPPADPTLDDRWLCVEKRLWERPGLQIAEVRVEGAAWSTIAVRLDAADSDEVATALERWRDALERTGMAASYPTWLLTRRWIGRAEREPSAVSA